MAFKIYKSNCKGKSLGSQHFNYMSKNNCIHFYYLKEQTKKVADNLSNIKVKEIFKVTTLYAKDTL